MSKSGESASSGFMARLLRRPLAVVCLAYLVAIVAVGVLAPILLPGVSDENAGDLFAVRQSPSSQHVLGTDTLGRDVLERLLVGTRVTLIGAAEALAVVLLLGVPVGLLAGFLRGRVDKVVSWLADLAFSSPHIVITLVVLSVFPQSMTAAMVTLGALASPGLMRVVRSATLPIREELYIAAARVSGLSRPYIIARHVLPRVAGPVIVQASLIAAVALMVQSGLAYLQLVVKAPAPSWGGMIADGITVLQLQPWLIWPPGIILAITVLAIGLLSDAVRDTTTETWSLPAARRRRRAQVVAEAVEEPGTRTDVVLSVQNLEVAFPGRERPIKVVDGVSFDIHRGETVGIVGESGCGKSVTAMSVLGLLSGGGEITSGQILFHGRDLAPLSERELQRVRGRHIGLVSQEPMISLNPVFRVGQQIAEAVRIHHGVSRQAARVRTIDLLRRVHLPDPQAVAQTYPHELSGGMAQRVSIARALAGDPELLIADEPTTALDVTVQAEILDLLRELQSERSTAILLVTHDWGVVADICDRVVVMYAGQIVERAELFPIFRQPLHPYTRALLASNPHHAPEAEILPTILGTVPAPTAWPAGCHFQPRCEYSTAACAAAVALVSPVAGRQTRCIHHERLLVS